MSGTVRRRNNQVMCQASVRIPEAWLRRAGELQTRTPAVSRYSVLREAMRIGLRELEAEFGETEAGREEREAQSLYGWKARW